jgi:uncharacterized protein (TIGR03067 family)
MLSAPLMLALALAPADAPTPPPDCTVSDAGELQGEWEVVSMVQGRQDFSSVTKGDHMVFAGPSVLHRDTAGRLKGHRGWLRVDPAADRPHADLVYPPGDRRPGIYLRSGDQLSWAWGQDQGARPSSFEPAEGVMVWTLRRVKK